MVPPHRNRRLVIIAIGAAIIAGATWLTLTALEQNVAYFYTPSEVKDAQFDGDAEIRLGGLVETGSVVTNGAQTSFRVTDGDKSIEVKFTGILPDLFREGQGVVSQGRFSENGVFYADRILAKHDENYVPRELQGVMDKAKDAGHPE